jgi:hypothetical protein
MGVLGGKLWFHGAPLVGVARHLKQASGGSVVNGCKIADYGPFCRGTGLFIEQIFQLFSILAFVVSS